MIFRLSMIVSRKNSVSLHRQFQNLTQNRDYNKSEKVSNQTLAKTSSLFTTGIVLSSDCR